jgi:DNA-binding MarR family transcriptional regulator
MPISGKPPVEGVADHLHSAAIHLLRRLHKQDEASGIGPARLSALSVLVFGGPMTLGQLAVAERVRPPTMSRVVAGLKSSGLVETVRDPQDKRRITIRASARGTRILRQARKRRLKSLSRQLRSLSREEIRRLREAVEILEGLLREWEGR